MNAYRIEIILSEDGSSILKDLPFHMGDAVEVIILEKFPSQEEDAIVEQPEQNLYPLRGKVDYYEDPPFEPAVPVEDWEVLQ
jgi:hypothetical protein